MLIVAGAQQRDGTVGSVYLKGLIVVEMAEADVAEHLAHTELRGEVVQVEEFESRLARQVDGGYSDCAISAPAPSSDQVSAGGHRSLA